MLQGIVLVSSLFAASALANPVRDHQARQLGSSQSVCAATYTSSCSNTVQQNAATAWCASLGYGTSILTSTVTGTGTTLLRKTILSTATSFTATTTTTAPTSTATVAITKTAKLTSVSTLLVTRTTSTVTINAAGTIETCGTYTATYDSAATPTSTASTPTGTSNTTPASVPSTTSASTTAASTTTASSVPYQGPSGLPAVVDNRFHTCPQDNLTTITYSYGQPNRTSFEVSCGSDLREYGSGSSDYNPGPYKPNVATIQDCLAMCLQDAGDNCGGVTYVTGVDQDPIDGPRCYYRGPILDWWNQVFSPEIYPPAWGLNYDGNYNHQWYWTAARRMNYAPAPNAPAVTATPTNPYRPAYSVETQFLPTCTSGNCGGYNICPQDNNADLSFNNYVGGTSTFRTYCDQDLLEQGARTNYWVWAESLSTCIASCIFDWSSSCGGVTFITEGDSNLQYAQCWYRDSSKNPRASNTTRPGDYAVDPSYQAKYVSGLLIAQSAIARREESLVERQALAKPACLKAPSAAATTSACNCVIPSSTTTRTTTKTVASTITSTRTIATTLKTMSTFTSTPIKSITKIVSTTTETVVRTTTSTFKTVASTTTTGTWTLASTPASFYVVDQRNGVAMWPADADEIFYNVQYDDSPDSSDPPPTVFGLSGTQLVINDFVDMDVVVVGQPFNGTGSRVMAFDRSNAATPNYLQCKIGVNADGTCPLRCTDPRSGGTVSWQDASGSWYLSPAGSTVGATIDTYVLQDS